MFISRPPLTSVAFVHNALLFSIAVCSFVSTISAYFLFLFAFGSPLSADLVCFLFFIASDGPLSIVPGCLLFFTIGYSLSFIVLSLFSSFVASSNLLFIISNSCFLSSLPPADSSALILIDTLFYICCSSLSFLPLFNTYLPFLSPLFTHNLALLTKKILFD